MAGQVIPWNFPLLMAAWKIAPALAAGNTVVIKPAETTPLSILVLAEIIADADLPPGVVNIITGAGDIGAALVNHPGIDKVAFTGSTEVGKQIQSSLAGTGRKITLELGGKAANIVFDDAPIDQAVEGIVNGIFFNQGHVCCAGSRLLVQESVADEVDRASCGRGSPRCGSATRWTRTPTSARSTRRPNWPPSARWPTPARPRAPPRWTSPCPLPDRGFFFAPTVFTEVSQSMRIAREEIFGPVLSVLTFRTPDEAVAKANNTPYGLSAGVWTEKGSRILGMASALRAGVVWANTFNRFDPTAAFGGYKESGFGREGGRSGLGRLSRHRRRAARARCRGRDPARGRHRWRHACWPRPPNRCSADLLTGRGEPGRGRGRRRMWCSRSTQRRGGTVGSRLGTRSRADPIGSR